MPLLTAAPSEQGCITRVTSAFFWRWKATSLAKSMVYTAAAVQGGTKQYTSA